MKTPQTSNSYQPEKVKEGGMEKGKETRWTQKSRKMIIYSSCSKWPLRRDLKIWTVGEVFILGGREFHMSGPWIDKQFFRAVDDHDLVNKLEQLLARVEWECIVLIELNKESSAGGRDDGIVENLYTISATLKSYSLLNDNIWALEYNCEVLVLLGRHNRHLRNLFCKTSMGWM